MTSQTVLEWTYKPSSFFEIPIKLNFSGGVIYIAEGKARGEFKATFYSEGRSFRDIADDFLRSNFLAQQVLTHKSFTLSLASMSHEYSNGRRDVIGFPETLSVTIGISSSIDFVHRSADGTVLRDTRAERLSKQATFRSAVGRLFPTDFVLKRIMQSYGKALADQNNFFVYLDEIRETLKSEIGSESEVCKLTKVSNASWSKFGDLANNKPLLESRHRGRYRELRKSTREEVDWALEFARSLIEGYVNNKLNSR